MFLMLSMLLWSACIFCAYTPEKKTIAKQMPAGVRHLEELQELRSSQEYSEINDEIKSALPRTPQAAEEILLCLTRKKLKKPVAQTAEQQEDPMRATIRKFYAELGITVKFDKDSPK